VEVTATGEGEGCLGRLRYRKTSANTEGGERKDVPTAAGGSTTKPGEIPVFGRQKRRLKCGEEDQKEKRRRVGAADL